MKRFKTLMFGTALAAALALGDQTDNTAPSSPDDRFVGACHKSDAEDTQEAQQDERGGNRQERRSVQPGSGHSGKVIKSAVDSN